MVTSIKTKSVKQKKTLFKSIADELKSNKELYILAIPVLAFYLIFLYGPMFGIMIAFKDYNIIYFNTLLYQVYEDHFPSMISVYGKEEPEDGWTTLIRYV